ncbi:MULTISPECIES: glycosyltransferase family 2 protein [Aquimarina]|uniref:Glycosyltransferase family 2 protein n=1 Tax=Aquimarina rubra TaxID=1920033 RepID=A0ABW5LK45_9FLAO
MSRDIKLSLVVPVYFEEEVINQFIKEVVEELDILKINYEVIFIDDGSTDNTVNLIKDEAKENDNIKLLELSYNHGKQAAVTAGINYSKGEYLIYMDPDLQDPPKEIKNFIVEIEKGYDLVFGVRKQKKDSLKNRFFSKIFWSVLDKYTGLDLPRGLAVMRIFNRDFAERFLMYKEQNRFIEGIFMHIGMNQSVIEIEQRERFAGVSKFNFKRKMNLAFDAIFDFSELPLKLAVRFGIFLALIGTLALFVILIVKLFFVDFQPGWPSIFGFLILSLGIQLFFIGLLALYIGRIYRESKSRPLFSIKDTTNI